jgi:mannose-6-phosphate isomerase-like protein (cupin superfamily)
MSRTGETLVDLPEATVRVLADRPELVLTYMRSRNEGGPGRHLHRQHADGFVVLEGEFAFELGDERATRGAGTTVVIPPEVIHRYEHETTHQAQFLNIHAPAMGFADYLFGELPPEEADNFFDPPEPGRPASEAITLAFADEGETVTDRPERTIRILADLPELVLTWTRYVSGEEGPGPHIHKEHVDALLHAQRRARLPGGPGSRPGDGGARHVRPRAAARRPHVPKRGSGRGDLAQSSRTFQGFRGLPPQSGHALG